MKNLIFCTFILSCSFSEELISTVIAQKVVSSTKENTNKTKNIILQNVQLKNKTSSKKSINIKTNRGIKIIGKNLDISNISIDNMVTSKSVTNLSSNSGVEIEKK